MFLFPIILQSLKPASFRSRQDPEDLAGTLDLQDIHKSDGEPVVSSTDPVYPDFAASDDSDCFLGCSSIS